MLTLLRFTLFPLLRLIFVKKVEGLENIPKGKCIIASNHASYGDGPLLYAVLYPHLRQKIHFVAWKALKSNWFLRWIIPCFGGVFENGSIEKLEDLLKRGHVVGIYPEGGRTHTDRIQKVKHTGLGVLAATSTPVVPVHTIGMFELWPYNKLLPKIRKSIEFRIGKPFYYSGKKTRKDFIKFGNKVMKVIDKL